MNLVIIIKNINKKDKNHQKLLQKKEYASLTLFFPFIKKTPASLTLFPSHLNNTNIKICVLKKYSI